MKINKEIHRKIMFSLLKEIFENEVGKKLAFKGGTACYFLHNLDRFSTDLDFDYLGTNKDSENIDLCIINIAQKYGDIKKGSHNLKLSYGSNDVNIKIDINRKIWENNHYEILNFYGTNIKVQDKKSTFSNKLVALTERNTNRDIYDVYFFFKNNFPINEKLIQERTGKTKTELFQKITQKLESFPKSYKILDGLGEVLNEKQKFFVKEKMLPELIAILQYEIHFAKR
ncbi:nucleotidyl transferase AbiEii/AbiGii toxin family protein [Candidatus Gracilibacteria bacterium]|nr:nucleotidyl transferase AbiEii/AbiGii toxin family protein [Candidatus Gracilibacteria bacterium]